jgi:hypothetical protein
VPDYSTDVLADPPRRRRRVVEVAAEPDLVVETADGGFCGAVVHIGKVVDAGERRDAVTLEDRHGNRRVFPMLPAAFLLDGRPVTLIAPAHPRTAAPRARTASGSIAVRQSRAQVARASRIWVEGVHDAALVERIWGEDLRVEGIVVEPMDGVDTLPARLAEFRPSARRRVGVLVDHLVADSKESRIVSQLPASYAGHVLVTGHPYVDIWQAVKPGALGIERWPDIPRTIRWKEGVCAALGVHDPGELWRRVLAAVDDYTDVEVPLLRAMEELIDFVTA